eukprot:1322160-Pyramimonas_sp.AAC.1
MRSAPPPGGCGRRHCGGVVIVAMCMSPSSQRYHDRHCCRAYVVAGVPFKTYPSFDINPCLHCDWLTRRVCKYVAEALTEYSRLQQFSVVRDPLGRAPRGH